MTMVPNKRQFLVGGVAVGRSPLVPATLARALHTGTAVAAFAHFGLETPVRVWSRSGNIEHGGYTWQGVGTLGRITAPIQNLKLGLKQVVFELRGVPQGDETMLGKKVRNKPAQVWIASIKNGRVNGELFLMLEATLDYLELEREKDGRQSIKLYGNVGPWSTERASNVAWTHERQIDLYPGDTGLQYIPEHVKKDLTWKPPP